MDDWRKRYQSVISTAIDEYIPCPGSINHFAITLPNGEIQRDDEPEIDDDPYP